MGLDRAWLVQHRCLSLSWQRGYGMESLKRVLLLVSLLDLAFLYYSVIVWAMFVSSEI